jgi:hypothetical protein
MAINSNLDTFEPRRTRWAKKVKLLSGGYVKPEAFPNGEITVYPWDTEIDDWLANRSRGEKQYMMLFELCERLCNLNGCPLESFLIGDVNIVLLTARAIRRNNIIEYGYECPSCKFKMDGSIGVPEELGRIAEKGTDYPGYDEITLPDSRDIVRIRPLSIRDVQNLEGREKQFRQLMTDSMMRILQPVVTVGGGAPSGWEEITTWFKAISPRDAVYLKQMEDNLYPHLDTDIPHKCDRCGIEFTHPFDFGSEFFRSGLSSVKGSAVPANVRTSDELKGPDSQS